MQLAPTGYTCILKPGRLPQQRGWSELPSDSWQRTKRMAGPQRPIDFLTRLPQRERLCSVFTVTGLLPESPVGYSRIRDRLGVADCVC